MTAGCRAGVGPSTLRRTSTLYEALLGSTYLGGCGEGLRRLGDPKPGLDAVRDELERACPRFEHASTLFTEAVLQDDASILVRAARETLATAPVLARVHARLQPFLASLG